MSAPQVVTAAANPPKARHRHRGPRRRGPPTSSAPQETQPLDSASLPTSSTQTPTSVAEAATAPLSRGGVNIAPISRRTQTAPRRQWGGRLTQGNGITLEQSTPSSSATILQASAPEFRPGQPLSIRPTPQPPLNNPNTRHKLTRQVSKSTAPDLPSRIHEDIVNKNYECSICTSEVLRTSRVWTCHDCWTVLHLTCVTKWSKNEVSRQVERLQDGSEPPPRQWRCPGCNLPKSVFPSSYSCWCGKEDDPKPINGLNPHSCGQTCGKVRMSRKSPDQSCPHPCEEQCHAGPCPPCSRNGPIQPCYCGKDQVSRRCVDTIYNGGSWSCGRVCGDIMPCGEHECLLPCHEGLCGNCAIEVESRCYCGKVEKLVPCSRRGDEKESEEYRENVNRISGEMGIDGAMPDGKENSSPPSGTERWIGSFTCDQQCNRKFDCGEHSCSQECHPQTAQATHCPRSPDVITTCPCGKTLLSNLDCYRTFCLDPIKHCQKTCDKTLRCGHTCQQTCHNEECKPCLARTDIICRCGRTTSSTICHQGVEEAPQCMRTCKALFNCGRHECGERCCPAEKTANERQASKRKMRSINAPRNLENEFEAEHICTKVCGRPLKCGNESHKCQELCHKGPCGSCREAIFDEVACNCGSTVLQPPLPCGTQPPACQFPCNRLTACGHPIIPHTCHQDENCPKCPYLVQKQCMCGKSSLKNQPCWSTQVSCGQPCGKRLRCGIHRCQKTCHRAGECEDSSSQICPHICGQMKTACEHSCLAPCHAPYACKEDKPCQSKVIITCDCGRLKDEIKCLATKTTESTVARKTLDCDNECLRLIRNAKLAQALNVDPAQMDSSHNPYSSISLETYRTDAKWAQVQEREFRVFAADDTEKRLRFKPMKKNQRAFIHALAEDFGLDSESLDPEPNRHVVLFKTPRFVSAPMKTLSQCMKDVLPMIAPPTTRMAETVRPYNGLLLTSPRFALTLEELRGYLGTDLASVQDHKLSIAFLPSEEVVIHESGLPLDFKCMGQPSLMQLQSLVAKTVTEHKLARGVFLCSVDQSLNVVRRENEAEVGGWSQVVKGVAPKVRMSENGLGSQSSFTVLGTNILKQKAKKVEQETVVDDWESLADGLD